MAAYETPLQKLHRETRVLHADLRAVAALGAGFLLVFGAPFGTSACAAALGVILASLWINGDKRRALKGEEFPSVIAATGAPRSTSTRASAPTESVNDELWKIARRS